MATPYDDMFKQAEVQYGLPAGYLGHLAHIESYDAELGQINPAAQNPNSSAGGLFQFIDSTAADYGLTGRDRFDPAKATDAAARLTVRNARALRDALGRDPTPVELVHGAPARCCRRNQHSPKSRR